MPYDNLSWLTNPTYDLPEAAELILVNSVDLQCWFVDHVFADQTVGTLTDGTRAWSFLQLVEAFVVGRFIEAECSLQWIASVREHARETIGVDHAFATHRFRLSGNDLVCGLNPSRTGLPKSVREGLLLFDYGPDTSEYIPIEGIREHFVDHDYACRFHPYGRSVPVVVDPRIYSGRPTIAGTRIPASTISGRHQRGESIASLADDFELAEQTVTRVLQFAK